MTALKDKVLLALAEGDNAHIDDAIGAVMVAYDLPGDIAPGESEEYFYKIKLLELAAAVLE